MPVRVLIMSVRVLLLALALAVPAYANAQTAPAPNDGISRILRELERVLSTGDARGFTATGRAGRKHQPGVPRRMAAAGRHARCRAGAAARRNFRGCQRARVRRLCRRADRVRQKCAGRHVSHQSIPRIVRRHRMAHRTAERPDDGARPVSARPSTREAVPDREPRVERGRFRAARSQAASASSPRPTPASRASSFSGAAR